MREGSKIRVMIVDDHALFREGLRFLLYQFPDIEVIGESPTAEDFFVKVEDYQPDVILMDISLPLQDGITATQKAMERNPALKIIALSMYGDQLYYKKMIDAGAKGYILKHTDSIELIQAIRDVNAGKNYFSQDLLRSIISELSGTLAIDKSKLAIDMQLAISSRELEVLHWLCRGYTTQEIADKLCISARTVEGHKASLMNKADCKNTASLIVFALKNKLTSLE